MPLVIRNTSVSVGVGTFIAVANVHLPGRSTGVFEGKYEARVESRVPIFIAYDGHVWRGFSPNADLECEVLL